MPQAEPHRGAGRGPERHADEHAGRVEAYLAQAREARRQGDPVAHQERGHQGQDDVRGVDEQGEPERPAQPQLRRQAEGVGHEQGEPPAAGGRQEEDGQDDRRRRVHRGDHGDGDADQVRADQVGEGRREPQGEPEERAAQRRGSRPGGAPPGGGGGPPPSPARRPRRAPRRRSPRGPSPRGLPAGARALLRGRPAGGAPGGGREQRVVAPTGAAGLAGGGPAQVRPGDGGLVPVVVPFRPGQHPRRAGRPVQHPVGGHPRAAKARRFTVRSYSSVLGLSTSTSRSGAPST